MNSKRITIRHIVLTGPDKIPADLELRHGLNVIYGASNTGKSYAVKVINFMLGSSQPLPELPEGRGYDRAWLGLTLEGVGDFSLSRSALGGDYELYRGLIFEQNEDHLIEVLAAKQRQKANSLGKFLLDYLGIYGSQLAKNAAGEKDTLSIRDLVSLSLVDEESIQSERSPIETGEFVTKTKERSLFRFLIGGVDDSSISKADDFAAFVTSKSARIEVVEEMIGALQSRIEAGFPDIDTLEQREEKIEADLEGLRLVYEDVQVSMRGLVARKRDSAAELSAQRQRLEEIDLHLRRFERLDEIYVSDIERLQAIEDAGFLLSTVEAKACGLCGAAPENQTIAIGGERIADTQRAAEVEISKIEILRSELASAVNDLKAERSVLADRLPALERELIDVEQEIKRAAPTAIEASAKINEVIQGRDYVRLGLSLRGQREALLKKLNELRSLERPARNDKPMLKVQDSAIHEFCKVVSSVLRSWHFPGECVVSFDDAKFELKIDGKLRSSNGKGVRAITHSAFKVALLMYCRSNNLPHPGFLVLDSPLITYRDPIKGVNSKDLDEDEAEIAQSSLKEAFFEHLSSIAGEGQIIVIENVDPPSNIHEIAHVQVFYGDKGGERYGFFPKN